MRGVRLQAVLRGALVLFVVGTIVIIPPTQAKGACYAIASVYAVFAVCFAAWARRARQWTQGGEPDDLPKIIPDAPAEGPREVFVYFISAAKERNPAAAMALIRELAAG